jgi:formylglycine-generating enzyme required for sulfatase activity
MINPAVTPGTEAAVLKAMDMQPQERFGSAVEFATALNLMPPVARLKQPPARSARLYSFLTVGGLIVLLLGFMYLFLKDRGSNPPPPTEISTNYTTIPPTSPIKPPTRVPVTPPAATQADTAIEPIETTVSPSPTITSTATPVKSLVLPGDPKPGDILPRPADGMIMIYISPGEFKMGSSDSDVDALPGEKPQHTVYLDEYWIDKTEVTNAQYALCVAAGKCQLPSESVSESRSSYYGNAPYINYPVIYVSWEDAAAYCEWAGGRLPTEAEWEKAARGADGRIYPWGDQQPVCQLTNYKGCNNDTSEVGSYPDGDSQYGLSDMAGNVWEWVQDWFDESYYAGSPNSNPAGPPSGQFRVLRGGGYYDDGKNLRSTFRNTSFPDITFRGFGFRCAASPRP